jgi:ADP-ribosylation factor GTPase-activating protein 2/3
MDDEIERELSTLRAIPENRRCFDCDSTPATWASLHFGVFICMNCAGIHRGFGTHITLVRSLELDRWNKKYCTYMRLGGNRRAKEHFGHISALPNNRIEKYLSEEATRYKKILKDEVYSELGLSPEPEILPAHNSRRSHATSIEWTPESPNAIGRRFQREPPAANHSQICPYFCVIL